MVPTLALALVPEGAVIKTNDDIVDRIVQHEGGFSDNRADRGGPTNFGITLRTLSVWLGRIASVDEVRNLTVGKARDIYFSNYIESPHFDAIEYVGLRYLLVDSGVLHGTANATRFLQRALRVKDDGRLGPITMTAANARRGDKLAILVHGERLRFIGRLITNDLTDADKDGIPDNTEFASGWLSRFADVIEEAAA